MKNCPNKPFARRTDVHHVNKNKTSFWTTPRRRRSFNDRNVSLAVHPSLCYQGGREGAAVGRWRSSRRAVISTRRIAHPSTIAVRSFGPSKSYYVFSKRTKTDVMRITYLPHPHPEHGVPSLALKCVLMQVCESCNLHQYFLNDAKEPQVVGGEHFRIPLRLM